MKTTREPLIDLKGCVRIKTGGLPISDSGGSGQAFELCKKV